MNKIIFDTIINSINVKLKNKYELIEKYYNVDISDFLDNVKLIKTNQCMELIESMKDKSILNVLSMVDRMIINREEQVLIYKKIIPKKIKNHFTAELKIILDKDFWDLKVKLNKITICLKQMHISEDRLLDLEDIINEFSNSFLSDENIYNKLHKITICHEIRNVLSDLTIYLSKHLKSIYYNKAKELNVYIEDFLNDIIFTFHVKKLNDDLQRKLEVDFLHAEIKKFEDEILNDFFPNFNMYVKASKNNIIDNLKIFLKNGFRKTIIE